MQRSPRPADFTPRHAFDAIHQAANDRAMQYDRARQDAGERSWTRYAIAHELCPPGVCWPFDGLIAVTVIRPGLRARFPLGAVGEVAV